MDIKSKEKRSQNMAKIRSKDSQPETYIRKLLYHQGIRYRKNYSQLPGSPDLFFSKYHTVMFVNGCFWHRHQGCKFAYMPSSNQELWTRKFTANIERDRRVIQSLTEMGYRIIILWECTVKKMKKDPVLEAKHLEIIINFLRTPATNWIEL